MKKYIVTLNLKLILDMSIEFYSVSIIVVAESLKQSRISAWHQFISEDVSGNEYILEKAFAFEIPEICN